MRKSDCEHAPTTPSSFSNPVEAWLREDLRGNSQIGIKAVAGARTKATLSPGTRLRAIIGGKNIQGHRADSLGTTFSSQTRPATCTGTAEASKSTAALFDTLTSTASWTLNFNYNCPWLPAEPLFPVQAETGLREPCIYTTPLGTMVLSCLHWAV